jgi:hypothetical protein
MRLYGWTCLRVKRLLEWIWSAWNVRNTLLFIFMHVPTLFLSWPNTVTRQLERLLLPDSSIVDSMLTHSTESQLRKELREFLAPPDPSINHNAACGIQLRGTAEWFIQGNAFQQWKENGSLLWICGNRTRSCHFVFCDYFISYFAAGAGKTVLWYAASRLIYDMWGFILSLSSAIVEDIKRMQGFRPPSIAYYYFTYNDSSKRNLRGLLASLLFQLGNESDSCSMFCVTFALRGVIAPNCPVIAPLKNVLRICSNS